MRLVPANGSAILVVDDDPSTLLTFGTILTLAGYSVACASSGDEALRLVRSKMKVDLVLTDLRLPGPSGLEVLSVARNAAVTAVVMSAWGTAEVQEAAKRLGASEFIEKPLSEADLLRVVAHNLRRGVTDPDRDAQRLSGHAAIRWATVVVPVTRLDEDIPTVAEWSRVVGRSVSTLKNWCSIAGVRASDSIDFARGLRVTCQYQGRDADWYNYLSVVDPRTLTRFIERSHLPMSGKVPSVDYFLSKQRYILSAPLISATRSCLSSSTAGDGLRRPLL
jgi:CheY-like chemotaxis protein